MKNSHFFSRIIGLGIVAVALVGCSMKQGAGRMAPTADAKLASKSGAKVTGSLQLQDHYSGVIVSGKLDGMRADRKYTIAVHESSDCSGFAAPRVGAKVADLNTAATPDGKRVKILRPEEGKVIQADGKVMGFAKGLKVKDVAGKSIVVVSVNEAAGKEAIAACGTLAKVEMACPCGAKSMKNCKCDKMKKDCGCDNMKKKCDCDGMKAKGDCKCENCQHGKVCKCGDRSVTKASNCGCDKMKKKS